MSELILTSVPGLALDPSRALLRVVLVPRLTGPGRRLTDYGLQDWPQLIRSATFDVALRSATGADITPIPVAVRTEVDANLWQQFFGSIEVIPSGGQPVYADVEVPPTASYTDGIDRAYRGAALSSGSPSIVKARLDEVQIDPPAASPDVDDTPVPQRVQLDFHRALGLLREHPLVLRALGFVVELDVPRASFDQCGGAGQISVSWQGAPDVFDTKSSPWTAFEVNQGRWFAAPTKFVRQGYVDFQSVSFSTDPVAPLTSRDWRTATYDIDGAVARVSEAKAALAAGSRATADPAAGQPAEMPALRTAGISVLQRGRGEWYRTRNARARANVTRALADGDPLRAEDLVLGYRVDARYTGGDWCSLVHRLASYAVNDVPIGPGEFAEEGHVKPAAGVLGTDGVVRADEVVLRWDGWSLAVPKVRLEQPGRAQPSPVDGAVAARQAAADDELPYHFTWRYRLDPAQPAMPALRFGGSYQLRARVVDIAGGGLASDELVGDLGATAPVSYGRYEPLGAPEVPTPPGMLTVDPHGRPTVHEDVVGPGGGVDILVVRSDPAADPATPPMHTYPSNDSRLVLPPIASFAVAEQHDRLSADDPQTWRLARRALAVPRSSADEANPRSYTWLPDPAAVGVAMLARPFATRLTPTPVAPRLWGSGWPDYAPKRVTIEPGRPGTTFSATWSSATVGRVVVPPGGQATLAMSSYLTQVELADFAAGAWLGSQQSAIDAAVSGQNPVINPPRQLTVVHAVRRPLAAPSGLLEARRAPGETFAVIGDAHLPLLGLDRDTTVQVDVSASWDEWGDDPVPVPKDEVVASLPLGLDDAALPPLAHEFADTKHRTINYHYAARSRFRAYFDADEPESAFVNANTLGPVSIPSSARPAPPVLRTVTPALAWGIDLLPSLPMDKSGIVELAPVRRGGVVRVELAAPWFSTGEGERLGVIVAADPAGLDTLPSDLANAATQFDLGLDHLLTSVYRDPLTATGSPQQLLHTNLVGNGGETRVVQEPVSGAFVCVVPFEVFYADGRRFADIDLGSLCDQSYLPFVRLSLVRYQPDSLRDLEISPIVRSDFVSVLPTRTLMVRDINGSPWVMLAGPSLTDVGNRVEVVVELAPHGTDIDALASMSSGGPGWQFVSRWTGRLNQESPLLSLPEDLGYRLRVTEVERIAQSVPAADPLAAALGSRTVFAHTMLLRP